ncbi:MAG: DUF3343 domain-containing protein [Clostridia bacterium]|nr:DUF3343 domain-containing protein [Clostridia bacterium]
MEETFALAAFRSRQQVFRFDSALRRNGIAATIISTPREIQVGCGLSIQLDMKDAQKAMEVYRRNNPGNLIGFYRFTPSARSRISPL